MGCKPPGGGVSPPGQAPGQTLCWAWRDPGRTAPELCSAVASGKQAAGGVSGHPPQDPKAKSTAAGGRRWGSKQTQKEVLMTHVTKMLDWAPLLAGRDKSANASEFINEQQMSDYTSGAQLHVFSAFP